MSALVPVQVADRVIYVDSGRNAVSRPPADHLVNTFNNADRVIYTNPGRNTVSRSLADHLVNTFNNARARITPRNAPVRPQVIFRHGGTV